MPGGRKKARTTPDGADDVDSAFSAWLNAIGFCVNGCKVGVSHPSDGQSSASATGVRGVVATEDLPADHVLFRIPSEAVVSAQSSRFASIIASGRLRGWSALIATITLENADRASPWRAYLDALPRELDSPMFWSERQLELLSGTRVASRANVSAVREAHQRVILPFYKDAASALKEKGLVLSEEDKSLATWIRFGSIVLAYSFTVGGKSEYSNKEEPLQTALLPFADFLNATPTGVNSRLYIGDDGCMEMTTTEAVPHGAELINSYGDRANCELLLRYGYIAEHNPEDGIAFSLGELCAAAAAGAPFDALQAVRLRVRFAHALAGGRLPPLPSRADGPFVVREAIVVVGRRWRGVGGFGSVEADRLFELCDARVVREAARARLRLLDAGDRLEEAAFSGVVGERVARRVGMARSLRNFHRKMLGLLVEEAAGRTG
jgi:hypothetical protein